MSPAVHIYRIENEDLFGPYVADYNDKVLSADGNQRQPAPTWDGLPWIMPDQKFGFASIEQLIDWFDGFFDALSLSGFRVVRITINDPKRIKYGRRQLVFREYVRKSVALQRRTVIPWDHMEILKQEGGA